MILSFKEALEQEHSKLLTIRIAQTIFDDPSRLDELVNIFLSDEHRLVQRSSWVINEVFCTRQDWLSPYLRRMLDRLDRPVHNAGPRNIMRILQFVDVDPEYQSEVFDRALNYFLSPTAPIAVRAFSLGALRRICKKVPELAGEVISSLDLVEAPSSGLANRIKNEHQVLTKIKQSLAN